MLVQGTGGLGRFPRCERGTKELVSFTSDGFIPQLMSPNNNDKDDDSNNYNNNNKNTVDLVRLHKNVTPTRSGA